MLPRFRITHDQPSILANQWITSLVTLFRPQIEKVLMERDARIVRDFPSVSPASFLDDPNIEVLSRMPIAVDDQIDQIERALAAQRR
jgi:hypothetical protein